MSLRFMEKPHRVVCAAIRYPDGFIVAGVRHCDQFMRAQMEAAGREKFVGADQGFLDNQFKFLTREEAGALAIEAGQVGEYFNHDKPYLFSEDLY